MVLSTCPVLAFTPDIRHVLTVFDATHEHVVTDGMVYYRRAYLPSAGGALDQDAWLRQALDATRNVHNRILSEELTRRRDHERRA